MDVYFCFVSPFLTVVLVSEVWAGGGGGRISGVWRLEVDEGKYYGSGLVKWICAMLRRESRRLI